MLRTRWVLKGAVIKQFVKIVFFGANINDQKLFTANETQTSKQSLFQKSSKKPAHCTRDFKRSKFSKPQFPCQYSWPTLFSPIFRRLHKKTGQLASLLKPNDHVKNYFFRLQTKKNKFRTFLLKKTTFNIHKWKEILFSAI